VHRNTPSQVLGNLSRSLERAPARRADKKFVVPAGNEAVTNGITSWWRETWWCGRKGSVKWNIIKIQGDGSRIYLSVGGCEGGDGDGLRGLAGVRALSLTVTYGPFSRDYTQPSDLMRKRTPRIRRTLVTASTRIGAKQGNVFRRSGFRRKFHRLFNQVCLAPL